MTLTPKKTCNFRIFCLFAFSYAQHTSIKEALACVFLRESENRIAISDHMDSSLRKNIILKRIFHYLHRTPNIHCVRSTGENLFFYRRGTELLNCNIEVQQCLQSSNEDKAILSLFDGILAGRREQVPCRNFFEFTVASYPSKINVTGLPLARYTFFESFPKKTVGLQNLIWKIWI